MTRLLVQGMHGLGDNIHQRAVLKRLLPSYEVFIETPWPSVYHDLPIKCVHKLSSLRTQAKNSIRQRDLFHPMPKAPYQTKKIWYKPEQVRSQKSVLKAMLYNIGLEYKDDQFDLPVPWTFDLPKTEKPILVYRPLIVRKEWSGCEARNPDIRAYRDLIMSIRDQFFVISVADLVHGIEWSVSHDIGADWEFHKGELTFEELAALVKSADLTFNSPGFMTILSKSVGTPNICVFGGYESSYSFSAGDGAYLGIDTISPCDCFSHHHNCEKRIDTNQAIERIKEFVKCNCQKSVK